MRLKTACNNCVRRKQKCDQLRPCSRCINLSKECIYEISQGSQPSNSKRDRAFELPNQELFNKLNRITNLVEELGVKINSRQGLFQDYCIQEEPLNICETKKTYSNLRDLFDLDTGELESNLVKTFFKYINKLHLLILPERESHILSSQDKYDLALKYAICAYSLQTYLYLNNFQPVAFDDNIFYFKANKFIAELSSAPKLQLVQAGLFILQLEAGFGQFNLTSKTNVLVIKFSQILNLHSFDHFDFEHISLEELEQYTVGSFSIISDNISTTFHEKPPLTRLGFLFPLDPKFSMKNHLDSSSKNDSIKTRMNLVKLRNIFADIKYRNWEILHNLSNNIVSPKEGLLLWKNLYSEIEKIESYSWFDLELNDIFSNRVNLVTHPFLIGYIGSYILRNDVKLRIRYNQMQFLEQGDNNYSLYYDAYSNELKKLAQLTYNQLEILKAHFEAVVSKESGYLFYFPYFMHVFYLETLALPFLGDNSTQAKCFITTLLHKVDHLSKYWPLFEIRKA